MKQAITGYLQDEAGDWIVELACGHRRHVRHDPPWQIRPWVLTADSRSRHLGELMECGQCDRLQGTIPDDSVME